MKPLKIIYYLSLAAIAFLAILLIFSTFPIPGNYKLYVVQSGSMAPAIKMGSIVVVKPVGEYQKDDIISYENRENPGNIITHRIFEIKEENGVTSYLTKGDANEEPDERAILRGEVIGKVLFSVPFVGYGVAVTRQPIGFMFLIILPATLIIYDEIRKIKDEVVKMRRKKTLLFLLILSVSLMTFNFTKAYLADTETSTGNIFQVSTWGEWKVTEKDDFEAGTLSNVDTTTSPGDVMLTGAYPVEGDTVALWHLNEGNGSTAEDATGNNNDGTLHGDTKWVVGKYNQALEFDGDNDYVDIGTSISQSFTAITVEAWIKTSGSNSNIVARQAWTDGNGHFGLYAPWGDNNGVLWQIKTSDGGFYSVEGSGLNDNSWHHVAGTYDGSTMKIYIDGSPIGSWSASGTISGVVTNPTYIGNTPGKTHYFNGLIDEVRISNTAKSSFPIDYFSSGTIEREFNALGPRDWDRLEWDEELAGDPGDTDITIEVATSSDNITWSAWSTPSSNSPIDLTSLSDTQYIKWRATLTTTESDKTPTLKEVRVRHYSP